MKIKDDPIVWVLIPARGGSKGIPRKNLQLIDDKPLVAHSIEQALQSSVVSRVVVSSDDSEILSVADSYGADTVRRPAEFSGDTSSSEDALLHALEYLTKLEGREPDLIVFLQATSPIRKPYDIDRAIELFLKSSADSLFSAEPAHGFVWRMNENNPNSVTYDYKNRLRRQEIDEFVIENGSIYIFKPWVLRTTNNRLGGKIAVYRMGFFESLQIDEPADLNLVRWCADALADFGRPINPDDQAGAKENR